MSLNEIDIGGLTYAEHHELREMIGDRMVELREQGVPALRERFAEEAAGPWRDAGRGGGCCEAEARSAA
jgi:hypothetical protein